MTDYKASGVDIDAGNETVRRIRRIAPHVTWRIPFLWPLFPGKRFFTEATEAFLSAYDPHGPLPDIEPVEGELDPSRGTIPIADRTGKLDRIRQWRELAVAMATHAPMNRPRDNDDRTRR